MARKAALQAVPLAVRDWSAGVPGTVVNPVGNTVYYPPVVATGYLDVERLQMLLHVPIYNQPLREIVGGCLKTRNFGVIRNHRQEF